MVVSRKALDSFKGRKLRSLEDLKKLPIKEVDERLKALGAKWTTEPMAHQKVGLLAGLANPAIYLLYDPGLGKGHPAGTQILTYNGYKNVEELVPGIDQIIGADGRPKFLTGVFPKEKQRCFRFVFSDESSVICDEDHIWTLKSTLTDEVENKTTAELLLGDILNDEGRFAWELPITEPIEFCPGTFLIDPYLLGVLLSNGSLNQIIPIYVTNDELLVEYVKTKVPKGCIHTKHKIKPGRIGSYGLKSEKENYGFSKGHTSNNSDGVLALELRKYKLFPCKGQDKFIPDDYKYKTSSSQRLDLLRGMMDCDGINKYDVVTGGIPFKCKSERLARDVQFLVQSLGGTCTIRINGTPAINKNHVECYIKLPDGINPFEVYADKYMPSSRTPPRRFLTKIEYVDNIPTYCISVDSEDSLYLTEHCIVTHNTKIALDLLLSRIDNIKKTLILVPGVSNIGSWLDEIKRHAPGLSAVGFYDMTKRQKKEAIEGDHHIVVMTYMGWLSLLGIKKTKGKRDIDYFEIERIEKLFQMVVWDESDSLKNRNSLSFLAAERMVASTDYRVALSGTPFDKNPIDLWSQFYLLDYGYALGENITLFRKSFCIEKYNPFSRGFDYIFDKRKSKDLSDRIRHTAILYSETECFDLPKTVGGLLSPSFMVRSVPFPKESENHYKTVINDIKFQKNKQELKNAYIRMRKIAAGFMTISDTETGIRTNIEFDKNPKIEALLQLIKEIPEDAKIIIFNEFKYSGELICKALSKNKISNTRIFSGTSDKIKAMNDFKNDPKIRVLVGSRAICYGLNLQAANHLIVFESPDSTRHRTQLERRIRRFGQDKTTFIYELAVANSIDTKILASLRSGKALIDDLLSSDNPAEVLL